LAKTVLLGQLGMFVTDYWSSVVTRLAYYK
jgi:hypothetical protein